MSLQSPLPIVMPEAAGRSFSGVFRVSSVPFVPSPLSASVVGLDLALEM